MMKKLLIIEDDKVVSHIYQTKFIQAGYEVEVAYDGKHGLQALNDFRPDIVQLDLMLPDVNGIEIIERIRKDDRLKHTLIIVFSNSYLSEQIQKAWKAGADKCLSKVECTPKLMVSIVQKMVDTHSSFHKESTGPDSSEKDSTVADPERSHAPAIRTLSGEDHSASFIQTIPEAIAQLRLSLKQFHGAGTPDLRFQSINTLYQLARTLTTQVALAGMKTEAHAISAVEAFLKQLKDGPDGLNESTVKTIAQGVDFLNGLLVGQTIRMNPKWEQSRILVIDDETLSRRAIVHALKKIQLPCITLDNSAAALCLLQLNDFDLVFMDVEMPEMSGFDLCRKVREIKRHRSTPIVFVTGLTDFSSRAQSTLSGGNDIMAKPFLFMELALKTLILLHHVSSPGPSLQ